MTGRRYKNQGAMKLLAHMKSVLRVVNVAMIHTELYIHISLIYAASGGVLNCP